MAELVLKLLRQNLTLLFDTVKYLRRSALQKKVIPGCRHLTRNLTRLGSFVELEHLDKHFAKNKKKRPPREAFWSFFSSIVLKLHFEWKI